MAIGPISAASLSQYVLSSSNSTQLQQALQALHNSITSGDLNGAKLAFQAVQKLNQNSATASGESLSGGSQLATDLAALGSALNSGELTNAQSAFATVQSDLKSANSPSLAVETNAASQSAQLVAELLSAVNSSGSSSSLSDLTNSVLEKVYGTRGSLNVHA